jgi:hypothetical protein
LSDVVFGMPMPPGGITQSLEGFSVQLKGGTGPIMTMCPCREFLEIYKTDATFRLQTPESIDPDRTNPGAPYAWMMASEVGTSNKIVSRVLLQGRDIVSSAIFSKKIDTEAVVLVLHSIKESLLACEKAARHVAAAVDMAERALKEHGIPRDKGGKFVSPVPQVASLDSEVTNFLIHAKRTVQNICDLVPLFVEVERRDNNFNRLQERLAKLLGDDAMLTQCVAHYAAAIRYLIELRNFQEHAKSKKRTHINNFRVLPDGSIVEPMWNVTGDDPAPIREEMLQAIEVLISAAEMVLIHLVLAASDSRVPLIVVETPNDQVRAEMPIRYTLTLDTTRMRFVGPNGEPQDPTREPPHRDD